MKHLCLFPFFILLGCQTPMVLEPIIVEPDYSLSWENTSAPHPERKAWSQTVAAVLKEREASFAKAKDMKVYCPKFATLSSSGKLKALGELIVGITYYESGYSPTSRMIETNLGGKSNPVDPITKRPVASEGLLQLSYQDIQWAKFCEFDWSKDKGLSDKDPKKTIMDPHKNLRCGIKILANQIDSKGEINLASGVYWAVLREGGKYSKINEIAARVKKAAPDCQ